MKKEIRGFIIGVIFTTLITGTIVFASQGSKMIEVFYNNIGIFINGREVTPTDANGNIVEPFIYGGTTYLPVRAISEALGQEVTWDGENSRIYIGELPLELSFLALDNLISENKDKKIEEVTVSTVNELVSELGSNKKINLKAGVYDLSKCSIEATDAVYWTAVDDGMQLNINGIVNMTLTGDTKGVTEIITDTNFAEVLYFENCGNITIENIKAGHTPQEYECDAGVFEFLDSKKITVNNCYLYGCGSIGISLWSVSGFECNDTIITDCSLRGVNISRSTDVVFNNTKITENRAYADAILIYNNSDAVFNNCEISGNNNIEWSLIEISGYSKLTFNDSVIKDNTAKDTICLFNLDGFGDYRMSEMTLNNCTIENNKNWYEYNVTEPVYNDCTFKDNTFVEGGE